MAPRFDWLQYRVKLRLARLVEKLSEKKLEPIAVADVNQTRCAHRWTCAITGFQGQQIAKPRRQLAIVIGVLARIKPAIVVGIFAEEELIGDATYEAQFVDGFEGGVAWRIGHTGTGIGAVATFCPAVLVGDVIIINPVPEGRGEIDGNSRQGIDGIEETILDRTGNGQAVRIDQAVDADLARFIDEVEPLGRSAWITTDQHNGAIAD